MAILENGAFTVTIQGGPVALALRSRSRLKPLQYGNTTTTWSLESGRICSARLKNKASKRLTFFKPNSAGNPVFVLPTVAYQYNWP